MKFAPLELCKKLETLGCKSEQNYRWCVDQDVFPPEDGPLWKPCLMRINPRDGYVSHMDPVLHYFKITPTPAFTQNDFTGCHEQAIENAKLVWGNGKQFYCPCCEQSQPPYESPEYDGDEESCYNYGLTYYQKHRMIDSDDWVKFLEESLHGHND